MIRILALAVAGLLIAGCGSKSANGPCDLDPPDPACMQACDPQGVNTCPAGFHCSPDGLCTAQCTPGAAECGGQSICSDDGHCIDVSGDANFGPDADCPDVTFTATQVIPTVQLLIDLSGSMGTNQFPPGSGTTRYAAVRNALVGPGGNAGVVGQYQASVYFGATLYTNDQNGGNGCPDLQPGAGGTGRALNNLAAIANVFSSSSPGGFTPTGDSLNRTRLDMVAVPPPAGSPPIIVLATDGEPQTCADTGDNTGGRALTVSEAQAAFGTGIRTFVLSVGADTAASHLQSIANAGVGQDPVTGTAPFYVANDPMQLAMAFDAIIGGVASCDLTLDGDVSPGQAASGTVTLNGMMLVYGSDWVLVGTNIIRLTGAACTTLMGSSNPMVSATFPCGSVIE